MGNRISPQIPRGFTKAIHKPKEQSNRAEA